MIAALGSYLFALFTALTERGRTVRMVRSGVIFLVLVFLASYWNLIRL
jgi:hypothetical protein